MKKVTVKEHYDLLIQDGNDPANDPYILQEYMNKWDGQPFIDALALYPESNVLEIGVGTGRLAKKVLEIGCGYFTGIDISPVKSQRQKKIFLKGITYRLLTVILSTATFRSRLILFTARLHSFTLKIRELSLRK